jgi:hypothetical protein
MTARWGLLGAAWRRSAACWRPALHAGSQARIARQAGKLGLGLSRASACLPQVLFKWRTYSHGLAREAEIMARLDSPYAMPLLAQGIIQLGAARVPALLMPLGRCSLQQRYPLMTEPLVQRYMVGLPACLPACLPALRA